MNITLPRLATALAVTFLLSGACAQAQERPIIWSLELEGPTKSFKRGSTLSLRVKARVREGWHLYAVKQRPGGPRPLSFSLLDGQPFKMAGAVIAPAAKASLDRNFNKRTNYYEGTVTFTLPVKISAESPLGTRKIRVRVSYQSCSEQQCFLPRDVLLETFVAVR